VGQGNIDTALAAQAASPAGEDVQERFASRWATVRGLVALGFVLALGLAGVSTQVTPTFGTRSSATSTVQASPSVARGSEHAPHVAVDATAGAGSSPSATLSRATVVKVIDGSTIRVAIGNARYTIQYLGISTPTTVRSRAKAANAALVAGREVVVEADMANRDAHGRLLGYVWVQAKTWTLVNLELARLGLATVAFDSSRQKYAGSYLAAEAHARARHLGWWSRGQHSKAAKASKAANLHKPSKTKKQSSRRADRPHR
jgi:endonuclease YncB( thermonuclease family)